MPSLSKYRQFSIMTMVVMIIAFVLSFASSLNSVINGKIKYAGWNIAFVLILFISGMIFFYLAYRLTDEKKAERGNKEGV